MCRCQVSVLCTRGHWDFKWGLGTELVVPTPPITRNALTAAGQVCSSNIIIRNSFIYNLDFNLINFRAKASPSITTFVGTGCFAACCQGFMVRTRQATLVNTAVCIIKYVPGTESPCATQGQLPIGVPLKMFGMRCKSCTALYQKYSTFVIHYY